MLRARFSPMTARPMRPMSQSWGMLLFHLSIETADESAAWIFNSVVNFPWGAFREERVEFFEQLFLVDAGEAAVEETGNSFVEQASPACFLGARVDGEEQTL